MDLGDGYSTDSSSICSSVDTSSYMSFLDESENLNDRRQAMLDLSISKIQTMNASNASFSLRKSLLIYNVMKSLQVFFSFHWLLHQGFRCFATLTDCRLSIIANNFSLSAHLVQTFSRELDDDACGVRGYNSLTEREVGAPVVSDVEMLEEASDVNAWERRCPDLGPDFMTYHTQGYSWLLDSSQFVGTAQNDANQDSEKCNGMYTVMGRSDSMDSEGIWSNPTANGNDSSVFMDDYLRMLGAWEDENCNPLTNCNLTQAEIMNMFNLPAYHLNSEVASQA
ncbi:unnamed protein product [Gongylonema pulchrum]|uniref:SERTA domain-containing protein n=1 Tax=Gongylonema pulchrum TaxID=637853 RepID=A0A183E9K5_9BILA|nr:unnamed protein product [Gongylonema pulchrum]